MMIDEVYVYLMMTT